MKRVFIGSLILFIILAFAIIFSSFSNEVDLSLRLNPPGISAPFGYDTLGRDLFSRVAAGVLVSFSIAMAVAMISAILGLFVAYMMSLGGFVSSIFIVACNTMKIVPSIILALFFASISGTGILNLIFALSLASISNIARTLYQKIKVIQKEKYISIAEGFGIGKGRIFISHVLPFLYPYMREQLILVVLSTILMESSLSYLGCGVNISTPSLGGILAEARSVFLSSPWMAIFPSAVLFLSGLSLSLISSGLRKKSEFDSSS